MVRTARFAFDDPRGPDHMSVRDPFDEEDEPLFESPAATSGKLPNDQTSNDPDSRPLARKRSRSRSDSQDRAA